MLIIFSLDAAVDLADSGIETAAELTLWLLSSPQDWDLARWPALAAAQRLSTRGRSVRLILDAGVLKELDQAARLELYGLAIKTGCRIEAGPVVGAANGNLARGEDSFVGSGSSNRANFYATGERAMAKRAERCGYTPDT